MPPSRIPPLLQPYTRVPPKDTLTLLTSVLGATTNWLVLRYLNAALQDSGAGVSRPSNLDEETTSEPLDGHVQVLLVSFIRDWEFWKTEGRRAVGLDLAKLGAQKKLVFIDGLSNLFLPSSETSNPTVPAPQSAPRVPVQNPRGIPTRAPDSSPRAQTIPQTSKPNYIMTLESPELVQFEKIVQKAVSNLRSNSSSSEILLIVDDPSILVSATQITSQVLQSTMLYLRSLVSSTVISLPADSPLIHLSPTPTPLELNHANLLVTMAHMARYIISLRLLDTGVAKDVSGVMGVTKGGDWDEEEEEKKSRANDGGEKELLYYISGDGGAKVFERGSGTDVG